MITVLSNLGAVAICLFARLTVAAGLQAGMTDNVHSC